ncbi:MAG: FAD-dependent oxidoreductase [Proteobacteria bacterium]|nr:FAD-dependent oxidoreductase [Burkholderiales bacterium]
MTQRLATQHWDVLVIGGGSAGISAAASAARNGARTLLVDAGPMIGGELLSGIPIDGCLNTRGEWVVGGFLRELLDECELLGGYVGHMFDWRTIWVVCCDPEIMKIAVMNVVRRAGVHLLLYSFAEDVVVDDGRVKGVVVLNKMQRTLMTADVVIDCSGDGDIAVAAGAPFEAGSPSGEFQPVSLVFRMQGVDPGPLLEFVRTHPDDIAVCENPWIKQTRDECIAELVKRGLPKVFLRGDGPLVSSAVARGEMYPTSLVASTPVSTQRREVSLNTTRLSGIDATRTDQLSGALGELMDQVWMCANFMKKRVPGYEHAHFAGIAPRIGIRETRRIMGDKVLAYEDVMEARKREDGIAKGAHHVDVHGAGSSQLRQPIRDGGSYDIPFGCLIPRNLKNVFIAGRCFSATREAHGSARVMGTCMAMGQAVGTAAALMVETGEIADVRAVNVELLRDRLGAQGAILEGTH